jgi:MFS family permease
MSQTAKEQSSPLVTIRGLLGVPRRTWRVFLICLVGVTFANLDLNLFALVLTDISDEFNWSIEERGWYLALTFIISGVLITQAGALADRIGRKRVLLTATWLTPLFVAALTFVPNTLALLIARCAGYTTAGVQSPLTGTLVMEESPPRYRGIFTGVLQVGFPIGFFLAAVIVGLVAPAWGWRYVFLAGLLFLPYAWIISRYLGESEAWLATRRHEVSGGRTRGIRDLFAPAYRRKTVILFIGQFLHVFAYGATILLPAYFREGRGWSLQDTTTVVGNAYLIGAVGYVAASFVGDLWLTRRDTIVTWCTLGGIAFGVMIWWTSSLAGVVATFGLMTFFFYGAYAVIFTFIAESFPAHLRATAAGFSSSFAVELGLGIGPLALSYSIAAWGWEWAFTYCATLPVILAGGTFLLMARSPDQATSPSASRPFA